MKLEISLSNVPRKTLGFYMTRNHYYNHVISLCFYLAGYKLDFTVMRSFKPSIRFYRFRNYA